jgi:RNA recognition motif-containing protein
VIVKFPVLDAMSEHAERPWPAWPAARRNARFLAGAGKKEIGMSTNIYVGNLPFSATEDEIHELFSAYGTVDSVNLIIDRETGRLRGFGFVEMASGGNEAITALDQRDLDGRQLKVNLARPREERSTRPRRW